MPRLGSLSSIGLESIAKQAPYPTISASTTFLKLTFDNPNTTSTVVDSSPNNWAVTMQHAGNVTNITTGTFNDGYYLKTNNNYGNLQEPNFILSSATNSTYFVGNKSWSIETYIGCTSWQQSNQNVMIAGSSGGLGWAVGVYQTTTNYSWSAYAVRSDSTLSNYTIDYLSLPDFNYTSTNVIWNHLVIQYNSYSTTSGKLMAFINGKLQSSVTVDKTTYDFYHNWKQFSGNFSVGANVGSLFSVYPETLSTGLGYFALDDLRIITTNPWNPGGFKTPTSDFTA